MASWIHSNAEEIDNVFLLEIYTHRASDGRPFNIRDEHITTRDRHGRSCLHIALLRTRNYEDFASTMEQRDYRIHPYLPKLFGWPSLLELENLVAMIGPLWSYYYGFMEHARVPHIHVDFNLVKKLIDAGVDVNALDSKGNSCLHYAAENEDCGEIISLLLTAGARLDLRNARGDTPLLIAIKVDNLKAVEALVHCGADINANNDHGNTSLHLAGCDAILRLLLNYGCTTSINHINQCGCSPLLSAVEYCEAETLMCMIQAGADVDFRHKESSQFNCSRWPTPLRVAVSRNRDEIVGVLLKYVANPNEICSSPMLPERKWSILMHAVSYWGLHDRNEMSVAEEDEKSVNILQLLITHGIDLCDSVEPFYAVIENGNLTAVRLFVNEFHRKNIRVPTNYPLLHKALKNERDDVFKFILESSFDDLDQRDSDGYTALHRAIEYRNRERAEVLLDYGANINTVNNGGKTILDSAICVHMSGDDNKDCMLLLLSHGSLPNWRMDMTNINIRSFPGLSLQSTIMHLALIESVGHSMDILHCLRGEYPQFIREMYESCKIEIQLSRVSVIDKSITVYDILTRIDHCYARNENLTTWLIDADLHQRFPIYENLIRCRIAQSQKMSERLLSAARSLSRILKIDCTAFYHIYENILCRLRGKDLVVLQQI